MDLNKLPKLSKTDAPAPVEPDSSAPQQVLAYTNHPLPSSNAVAPSGVAEAWISAIVGLLCILIGKDFARYVITKAVGGTFHTNVNWTTGPLEGQEVAYPDLQGFVMLNDSAMFLFGLALLFDAACIALAGTGFRFRRQLLAIAFVISVTATLFNIYAVVRLLGANVTPLMSLLAVAFGGYIAMYQWKILRASAVSTR